MTFNKGFVVSIISLALTSSAFAMSRHEDRGHDREDHGNYHPAAYRINHDRDHDRDDHRRDGWEKGKKNGWHGRDLPPGQARKHDRDWDRDRDHDRDRDYRARHHRRHEWERNHRRPVAQRPLPVKPMPTRPVATNSNRAWGDNVRARKAEIKNQQPAQQQGGYIKR